MKKLTKLAAIFAAAALVFGAAGCSGDDGGSGESKTPTVKTNADGTVTITIQEGQYGLMSCNGTVTAKDAASNGKDFENFPSTASDESVTAAQISYVVNTDTAGDYVMKIHYAFGGYCDYLRDANVYVNGVLFTGNELETAANNTLNFDYTVKSWSTYADASVTIPLIAGDNSILLKSANGNTRTITYTSTWANWDGLSTVPDDKQITGKVVSLPNIDYMSLTSPVHTPAVKLAAGSSENAYYSFTAASENTSYGNVTASETGSAFKKGTSITISAEPETGYVFDCWHGTVGDSSYASNSASIEVQVTGDIKLTAHFVPESYSVSIPAGYATVADDSGTTYTVTGGTGGSEITISSLADLTANKAIISGNAPYIIHVAARISSTEWIGGSDYTTAYSKLTAAGNSEEKAKFILDNRSMSFDIGSNKTIIGVQGEDYGFKNINPKISGENVIIQYLNFGEVIGDDLFGGSGNDAMSIKGGQHVWVDHCTFNSNLTPTDVNGSTIKFSTYKSYGGSVDLEGESDEETKWAKDFYDGLLDVSETSRFVTVSNCYFHDHWKACLCGGSNDKAETQPQGSQVRLTMCNNYFKNVHARMPLFRFGRAHIYSSYLYGAEDASAIEVRAESKVYVDHVYFENIKSGKEVGCWNSSSGLGEGTWTVADCYGCSSSTSAGFTPPYTWTPATAAESKANLPSTAGNK